MVLQNSKAFTATTNTKDAQILGLDSEQATKEFIVGDRQVAVTVLRMIGALTSTHYVSSSFSGKTDPWSKTSRVMI